MQSDADYFQRQNTSCPVNLFVIYHSSCKTDLSELILIPVILILVSDHRCLLQLMFLPQTACWLYFASHNTFPWNQEKVASDPALSIQAEVSSLWQRASTTSVFYLSWYHKDVRSIYSRAPDASGRLVVGSWRRIDAARHRFTGIRKTEKKKCCYSFKIFAMGDMTWIEQCWWCFARDRLLLSWNLAGWEDCDLRQGRLVSLLTSFSCYQPAR